MLLYKNGIILRTKATSSAANNYQDGFPTLEQFPCIPTVLVLVGQISLFPPGQTLVGISTQDMMVESLYMKN